MTEQERDEMIEQIFELTAVTHDTPQECIDILERKVAALEAENARLSKGLVDALDACKYGKGRATPEHSWKQWCEELISENRSLEAKIADLKERINILYDFARKSDR